VRRRGPRFDRAVRRCGWGRSSRSRTAAATGTTAATSATRATATASATTRNSDDSEDRTATTATATAGAMASCVEGRRERRPRGTAPQTATQDGRTECASTVRRRRDPDRVRDGPKKRERPGGGPRCGDTSRASKCLGALELQREGWGGWAERETPRLPSADCSGRRVGKSTSPFRRDWSYTTNK